MAEVIAGVVWYQLLQPESGVIDGLIQAVGLTPPEQGFLGTPELALATVFVVLTWKYLGLAILLFLAGLQGVPDDLYEAAQLDGASWWQVQRRIAIPLLGPTIRTWCFLSMIGSLQLFDMVWILTGGGPANATTTMATYLINQGTRPAQLRHRRCRLGDPVRDRLRDGPRSTRCSCCGATPRWRGEAGATDDARRAQAVRLGGPLVYLLALVAVDRSPSVRSSTARSAASAATSSWPATRPGCRTPGCSPTTPQSLTNADFWRYALNSTIDRR